MSIPVKDDNKKNKSYFLSPEESRACYNLFCMGFGIKRIYLFLLEKRKVEGGRILWREQFKTKIRSSLKRECLARGSRFDYFRFQTRKWIKISRFISSVSGYSRKKFEQNR